MEIVVVAVAFVLGVLITATVLFLGSSIIRTQIEFRVLLIIATISHALAFIPMVGAIIGLIALIGMLMMWTDADDLVSAVLLALVAEVIKYGGLFLLYLTITG